jgi:hypothetical protein
MAIDEVGAMAIPADKTTTKYPSVMPADMAREMFDQEARDRVGMSGEEFLRRYDAGEFRDLEDTPEGRKVSYLVMLIPFGRQNS